MSIRKLRHRLRHTVESSSTRSGWWFNAIVQGLIVVSMVAFAIETLPALSPAWRRGLAIFEGVTVAAFTGEYMLRLFVASRPVKYATSFFGVVDFLAIAPVLFGAAFDGRTLRALRLIRLVRLLKLARYNAAIRRIHLALRIAREELVLFFAVALILLFIAATGIYQFENEAQPEKFASIFHSLWWAVSTLTTVGYGDVYPITAGGRLFTCLVLLVGLGVVAAPTAMVASSLTKARQIEDDREIDTTID
jgi:voltage-gated potassium channel